MENEEFLKKLKTAYKDPTIKDVCVNVYVCVHAHMHKCVYQGLE